MTNFVRAQFDDRGEYVYYDNKFVARFKHRPGSKNSFLNFMVRHFTVEEYFAAMENQEGPLRILQAKGYLQPHIKRWLKEKGYEVSPAGYQKFIQDESASRRA